MVDSQPMEEDIRGAETTDVGTEAHEGPTEPVLQTQKTPSPYSVFIKENIDLIRTMIKDDDQQANEKPHQEDLPMPTLTKKIQP
ncbi:hypothetical protein Tco_1222944, partial [Tanacetum coccineum]